jgi:hypothetical protein
VPIHWQTFTRSSRVKSGEKRSSVPLRSTLSELLSYCTIPNSYISGIITVIPNPNLLLLGSLFCKYKSCTVQKFEDLTRQKARKKRASSMNQPGHFKQILLQNMQISLHCISILNFTSALNGSFVIATTLKSKTIFPRPMCYSQATKNCLKNILQFSNIIKYVIMRRQIKCSFQFNNSFICPSTPEICVCITEEGCPAVR